MAQRIVRTKEMAENLRELRLKKKMTQAQVAHALQLLGLDLGESYYSKYERGLINIRPDVLLGLTKIFNCKLEDFFEGIEHQKEEE